MGRIFSVVSLWSIGKWKWYHDRGRAEVNYQVLLTPSALVLQAQTFHHHFVSEVQAGYRYSKKLKALRNNT